ncbi:alpha-amylase family glycosyl hydrolase [Sphingomonas sp. R1]|uniref:alpha-amylase family glycosyl hydrolase n=1 Tax=Sphingomonas sp. R1 TaxID=399176 RepID=UPI002224406A|nr:alpha-amylase family glycosyl hydrolase [Sphingomonas sp. R1]UYY77613.1 alpha-amylase family glycosyl hydrolase [Sphingomonas sp. R1]
MIRKTALALLASALAATPVAAQTYRDRLPEDEVLYFLLPDRFENGDTGNDRGGLTGDRLVTGFDPTSKGFYHGGDLKGVIQRLDYIQALGATAIWVGPIFKNKPVQGAKGQESGGYHGYWITDFTQVDPHFGTNAEFKALVDAAHKRGIKVYMDIVVNHTADVIQFRECGDCSYRSRADYPYSRRGGITGAPINPGFAGDDNHSAVNFAKLTRPDFAYTPVVPEAEKRVKVPAWLNDPIYYHNRGNSTFAGESSTMGDFVGLDDLMTEHPRVVAGMIEIFGGWIDRFGIDGFRIDTARHVDPEFWQAFVPAMLARAKARGIPNFHIFGEVADPEVAALARHTRVDRFPAVLDFAFNQAVTDVMSGKGTDRLAKAFAADVLYEGGEATARRLPTFVSNHDAGRIATFIRQALPKIGQEELLQRVRLAEAMMLLLRGVPTIYSGDEQGFVSDGNDQDAREDMFGSRVPSYNDNKLLGSTATTATPSFHPAHPLFREIATLAKLRTSHPALTRGRQVTRFASEKPGLFAVSRFDPRTGAETVIAFNTSAEPWSGNVQVETGSTTFRTLAGTCPASAAAPGSITLSLPAFGYTVCAAGAPK